ncbi:MAG TPA: sulfotransferase, partial [Pirellulales bacterium]|nr:sulfotransferase [Pirellulales bacterium]
MGIRPNFLVIGAMKAGTTSLYELLRRHPQVGMCSEKEPAFFCVDERFARGWTWYESLFAGAEGKTAVGEASTSYTKRLVYPHAAERIGEHLADARLIYVVRHPLERIESQWMHGVHQHWHSANFVRALDEAELLDPSRYWSQISAYRRHFADERILVSFFDDLTVRPAEFMRRVFGFLGVDPAAPIGGLGNAENVTAAMESERPALSQMRRMPLFAPAMRVFPLAWRDEVKRRWFTRRGFRRPRWREADRRKVLAAIGDDVREFLR